MNQTKKTNIKQDSGKEINQDSVQKALHAATARPQMRRRRAILFVAALLALIGAFAALSVLVSRTAFFPIDLAVTRWVQSLDVPVMTATMNIVSWAGYAPQSFLLAVAVIVVLRLLGLHWEAVVCLLAAVFEELLNLAIKLAIHRPRPSADLVHVYQTLTSYSFPSGHVMFYTCFFGLLAFLCYSLLSPSWKRTALLVALGSQVLLVGISRIYLGEHWASDAVGAYMLGTVELLAIIQFYRWGKSRFFTRQPAAAGRR